MTGTWRAYSCTLRSGRFLRRLVVRASPKKEETSSGTALAFRGSVRSLELARRRALCVWLQAGIAG